MPWSGDGDRVKRAWLRPVFRTFGLLPRWARDRLIGWSSPAYRIGVVGHVIDPGGRVLLVRHSYRPGWGLPGGMLGWSEQPSDAVTRELWEECGIRTTLDGTPLPVYTKRPRRIMLVFDLRLTDGVSPDDATPSSPEIEATRWFAATELADVKVSRTARVILDHLLAESAS